MLAAGLPGFLTWVRSNYETRPPYRSAGGLAAPALTADNYIMTAERKAAFHALVLKVLEKLGMHHVLFVAFTVIAAVPVFTLAAWVEAYVDTVEVRTAATAISFITLLAAALVSWLFAKSIARPLQAVGSAAGAIAHGDMSVRAPTFSPIAPRELHELSGSFNHMVDELSRNNYDLAETARRAQVANRAKSEFLANMSHELRTPLNAILGFSEVMRDEIFGPLANPRYQGYVQDINSSAAHLIKVITDILDLSKAEAGAITLELSPLKIPEIFENTTRMIEQRARDGGITIDTQVDPQVVEHPIISDEGKVTQILLNLVSNSVKFNNPGGHVCVAAEMRHGTVTITVTDDGIGIAEADLATVLTPFGQVASAYTAREGFGLGLPLSKKLAERLGGSLSIESRVGYGTTISVQLPASANGPEESADL